MNKRRALPGFTLVEVLASVMIFTGVVGILFSALAAMQRTDLFRRDNRAVAQAADYAFEPLIQRLKEADAKETVRTPSGCVTLQGYYASSSSGNLPHQNFIDGTLTSFSNDDGRLIVITADRMFTDDQVGSTRTYIRRDYFVRTNNKGNTTLVEKTYRALNPFEWPNQLRTGNDTCQAYEGHWQPASDPARGQEIERELTGPDINVDDFSVSLIASTVPPTGTDAVITQRAPFITISLTVSKPESKIAKPVTLRTTLTPTFSYGETREN